MGHTKGFLGTVALAPAAEDWPRAAATFGAVNAKGCAAALVPGGGVALALPAAGDFAVAAGGAAGDAGGAAVGAAAEALLPSTSIDSSPSPSLRVTSSSSFSSVICVVWFGLVWHKFALWKFLGLYMVCGV